MNPKAEALRDKLKGALIPAVPVPFDDEGVHDEQAEKAMVKSIAASQAAGVAVWAHTGRGMHLTSDERHRVFKRWRIGLRPDQLIICGAGCPVTELETVYEEMDEGEYIERSMKVAQEAKMYGADGLLVYAPSKFRGHAQEEEIIVDYYESLAQVGLPIVLFYLYDAAGGITYSMPMLEKLLAIPEVAAIKIATLDSVMTFQDIVATVKNAAPDITILTGEDRFFGYSLMCGATGALVGLGSICPDKQVEMIESYLNGDYKRFNEISAAVDAFAQATFYEPIEGYIRRTNIALALDGIIPSTSVHDPWGPPIPHHAKVAIAESLKALKEV